MDYYLDCEFLEGTQKKLFGKTKPTIDLISIGLVSEDNREYYAISKDFNLKEAWNRYEMKQVSGDMRNHFPEGRKEYWIRYNILVPLFKDLVNLEIEYNRIASKTITTWSGSADEYVFSYSKLKKLLQKHGKSNQQIAKEVIEFCHYSTLKKYNDSLLYTDEILNEVKNWDLENTPKFYTYYGAYDWVVFCWLFGKMIELPKGFPMFSFDLKQILDEKQEIRYKLKKVIDETKALSKHEESSLVNPLKIKDHPDYPKQSNEHNALSDARWNFEFHKFIKKF